MSTKANLVIEQGATFSQVVDLLSSDNLPVNTTGMSIIARMKKDYESTTTINLAAALTPGQCQLYLSAANTAVLEPGRYVYNAEITELDGTVLRVLEGIVTVTPRV